MIRLDQSWSNYLAGHAWGCCDAHLKGRIQSLIISAGKYLKITAELPHFLSIIFHAFNIVNQYGEKSVNDQQEQMNNCMTWWLCFSLMLICNYNYISLINVLIYDKVNIVWMLCLILKVRSTRKIHTEPLFVYFVTKQSWRHVFLENGFSFVKGFVEGLGNNISSAVKRVWCCHHLEFVITFHRD